MDINIEPNSQHVTWIIKDFLELPQKDDFYLESPEFLFRGEKYCLRVYPNVNRSNGRRTKFQVRRLGVSVPKWEVSCKVGIKGRDTTGDDWYTYWPVELEKNVYYPRSWIEEKRDEYVPDGNYIIVCCLRLSKDSRAGSSAQEDEDQGGFPEHNSWSSPKMEMMTEFPCTRVQLTVPKFFDLPRETCDSLTSPEFRFAGDTYCVRFRANGDTADTDLELVRLSSNFIENTVSYIIGFCLDNGVDACITNSRSLVGCTGVCITRSELEEVRDLYVKEGTLRVYLLLRLEEKSSAGAGTSVAVQTRTGLSGIPKLQSGCRQILERGTESDASVVVRGMEFPVHGDVLPTRSNIFEREDKAMFDHDTTEKENGRLVVDDLDPESFGVYLEYLDTGNIQDKLSDDDVFGLYAAAEKYDVPTLKSQLTSHMLQNLSVDSFCDVMALALRPSGEELLKHAISFFRDNLPRIIRTPKWQQFNIDHGASVNEFLMKVFEPETQ